MPVVSVFLTITLFAVVFYLWTKYHSLIHPLFIISALLFLSSLCVSVNYLFFKVDIGFLTYIVVVLSVFFWLIGDNIAENTVPRTRKINESYPELRINKLGVFIGIGINLINTYFLYRNFVRVGQALGGTNFISYFGLVRLYLTEIQNGLTSDSYNFELSSVWSSINATAQAFAFVSILLYIYNLSFANKKQSHLLVIFLVFVPSLIFNTSRAIFLQIFATLIVPGILIYYKKSGVGKQKKLIKVMSLLFVSFFFVFSLIGLIRSGFYEDSGYIQDSFNSLTKYLGSPIIGIDYLLNSNYQISDYFARETCPIIYTILEKIGFTFPKQAFHFTTFPCGDDVSNVYTALRDPILDFGILGMLVTRILLGFIYGYIYRRALYYTHASKVHVFVLFGVVMFPIVFYFFADVFYYLTNVDFFTTVITLFLINRLFIKKHKEKLKRSFQNGKLPPSAILEPINQD